MCLETVFRSNYDAPAKYSVAEFVSASVAPLSLIVASLSIAQWCVLIENFSISPAQPGNEGQVDE